VRLFLRNNHKENIFMKYSLKRKGKK